MDKPRLFIPLSFNFPVRYIFRTGLLAKIASFATPIVLLAWSDPVILQELSALGVETYVMPEPVYQPEYVRIRRQIDTWYFVKRLRSVTWNIRERHWDIGRSPLQKLIRKARQTKERFMWLLPGYENRLLMLEQKTRDSSTNIGDYHALLDEISPDAGFCITPFLKEEELLLCAAAQRQIPLYTSLISFDNITTRGWMPVQFHHYMVWNRHNKAQVLRAYPQVFAEQVSIVGAPQFDFYRNPEYLWTETKWRHELALPPKRPVILYGGNSVVFTPNEPEIVGQLDDAIQNGELPGNPIILLRCHPTDIRSRWEPLMEKSRNIVLDHGFQTSKFSDISIEDIKRLSSTLKFSQVHISICSTMALDGAYFDKPQIAPAYDDRSGSKFDRSLRELYFAEHYQPIATSGGIDIVYSRDELIRALNLALTYPGNKKSERQNMLLDLCTYIDGECTQRVSDKLRSLLDVEVFE